LINQKRADVGRRGAVDQATAARVTRTFEFWNRRPSGQSDQGIIMRLLLPLLLFCAIAQAARAEDGHDLWLRYAPVAASAETRSAASAIVVQGHSPSLEVAEKELKRGLDGLLVQTTPMTDMLSDGAVLIGTPATSPLIASLQLPLSTVGPEGFVLKSTRLKGHTVTVIAANRDIGVVYGVFAFLRRIQTNRSVTGLDITDAPKLMVRVLNHWDNLDGSIERGYAGASLWRWQTLPAYRDPRYGEYARANASIGINGAVLNNVNSNTAILTSAYIEKVAALAEEFRPWGVKVWLAPRFTAPEELGALKTADPLDPKVRAWWRAKVEEIYKAIPDFGGFLIKANSEGVPGPQDYGRSHSDGANLYADLLKPHGGIVMYRAFVYDDPGKDWKLDRIAEAYRIITPFDGTFRDNVIVQEKEGPLDFQAREPFAPLFGAMPHSQMAVEFPVTKEYTGQGADLSYLGTMYEEIYQSDTHAYGKGSTVARIVEGRYNKATKLTGVAGVANTGNDRNWTGSIFNQANWYAFGRFAWDPDSSARAVGEEWTRATFGNDAALVPTVTDMLMRSLPALIDYQQPLGLAFLDIDRANTHYGPWPWYNAAARPDWGDVYYHRADEKGLGFDRSPSGYNSVAQYHAPLKQQWSRPETTPDEMLLWFHHLPWDYQMKSGKTLWEELQARYHHGVQEVEALQTQWAGLSGKIDGERFGAVTQLLQMQHRDAVWFRDAGLAYFVQFAKRPFGAGYKPRYALDYYKALPPNAAPPN
jgi:alpha-glucuronidase